MDNMEECSWTSTQLSLLKGQSSEDYLSSLTYVIQLVDKIFSFSTNEELKHRLKNQINFVELELNSQSYTQENGNLNLDMSSYLRGTLEHVIFKPGTKDYDTIFPVLPLNMGDLRETNDFLMEHTRDLLNSTAYQIAPLVKDLEDLRKKLVNLNTLLKYVAVSSYHEQEGQKLLTPLVDMLGKATCIIFMLLVGSVGEEIVLSVKHNLSDLLEKSDISEIYHDAKMINLNSYPVTDGLGFLEFFRENLGELLIHQADEIRALYDEIVTLHSGFDLLTYIFKQAFEESSEALQTNILRLAYEAEFLIDSYLVPGNDSCGIMFSLSDVVKEVNAIKEGAVMEYLVGGQKELRVISLPIVEGSHKAISLYNAPSIVQHFDVRVWCTVSQNYEKRMLLIKILGDVNGKNESFKELNIEELADKLCILQHKYLMVLDGVWDISFLDDLKCHLPDNSNGSRVVINSRLPNIEIKAGVKMDTSRGKSIPSDDIMKPSIYGSSISGIDTIVGFQAERTEIMSQLCGSMLERDVISIVGMPGIGKTTLAFNVYNNSSLHSFDVRAWCTVSQNYEKRELILAILNQVEKSVDGTVGDQDLADNLCKSLRKKKYLIALDDVWDINVWNDLKWYLPNDRNGSRILITTRHQTVSSKIESKKHVLQELKEDESWELFQRKLPQKENFSNEIIDIAKKIAQNCKGLPLAIVMAAGLLSKVEQSERMWNEISESVNLRFLTDDERNCMAIIDVSYNHLPDHLKSCFLYLGVFPEDQEIPVSKLKLLLIGEGFVRDSTTKSAHVVAEECVMDLIGRSLVIPSKERSLGGVKTIRVHDLLRDFCLKKAEEEHFLSVLSSRQCHDSLILNDPHRLSIINCHLADFIKLSCQTVRSLLFFHRENAEGLDQRIASNDLLLVRVLDGIINDTLNCLSSLIHLRYLAIRGTLGKNSIPSTIKGLRNLQFLIVESDHVSHEEAIEVPDSIWGMVKLRHVHIRPRASFMFDRSKPWYSSSLKNLRTLSKICLNVGDEEMLENLPKLEELGCIFFDSWDDSAFCYRFPVLGFLTQLTSLKVEYEGYSKYYDDRKRCKLGLPKNIKKLTLAGFRLFPEDTLEIGNLPYLEVLKLYDSGDLASTWTVNDEQFQKLKHLKLRDLLFCCWTASEYSFPFLEQLLLDTCDYLEEIPCSFGEIPNLLKISVLNCKATVDNSAREIEKIQRDTQNDELKVYIHPRMRWGETPNDKKKLHIRMGCRKTVHQDLKLAMLNKESKVFSLPRNKSPEYLYFTMAYTVVRSLLGDVDLFIHSYFYERDLLEENIYRVRKLRLILCQFQYFIRNCFEKPHISVELHELVKRIRCLVDRAEDVIAYYIVEHTAGGVREYHHRNARYTMRGLPDIPYIDHAAEILHDIITNAQKIVEDCSAIIPLKFIEVMKRRKLQEGVAKERQQLLVVEEEDMVGLHEQVNEVIRFLKEGSEELDVLGVVGIAGIGKTTLVKKVFKNEKINYDFIYRAWVNVSKDCQVEDILISILQQLTEYHPEVLFNMTSSDLVNEVCKCLKEFRYLIVLDDVWSVEIWDALKVAFPNNSKRSRILLTSQERHVVEYANINRAPYDLRFLSKEDGLDLLVKKVFRGKECPDYLKGFCELIVENCGGIPLVILVVAGTTLLSNLYIKDWLVEVVESMNGFIVNNETRILEVIAHSYNILTFNLKLCFIYLGFILEDPLPVQKLIRLWIAMGFVQEDLIVYSEEKTAFSWICELVDRNLVMVTSWGSNGQPKMCRVHDTLRVFCRQEAKKLNLYGVLNKSTLGSIGKFPRICDNLDIMRYISSESFEEVNANTYVISGSTNKLTKMKKGFERSRKNMFLPEGKSNIEQPMEIIEASKKIRVLDITSIKFSTFPSGIFQLTLLRYLAFSCDLKEIPSCISYLWNLQTLLILTSSNTLEFTEDIWRLYHLRHLQTNASALLPPPKHRHTHESNKNMQSLSTIAVESCTKEVFLRIISIKKLGVRGKLAELLEEGSILIGNFESLQELKNLKLFNDIHSGSVVRTLSSKFPKNLVKLTLSGTLLEWKYMSILGELEMLEVLKLKDDAFSGHVWQANEGRFPSLSVLYIDRANLMIWESSNKQFQSLGRLVLRNCQKLVAIPSSLVKLHSFQILDIYRCSKYIVNFAKKLQEEKSQKDSQDIASSSNSKEM